MVSLENSNLEKDVVQLIYCSQTSQKEHRFNCDQVISNIVDYSANRNSLRKVTSTLLTNRKFFAQIIEGPASEVNLLYKSILHDERHHSVTLLQHTVTNIRLFPRWSMTLLEVDDMSYVGRLSVQSTPGDLRKSCLSILKSLRPAFCGR